MRPLTSALILGGQGRLVPWSGEMPGCLLEHGGELRPGADVKLLASGTGNPA